VVSLLATVIHETGHALGHVAVGVPVRSVRIGSGHRVLRFHIGDTEIDVHAFAFSGRKTMRRVVGRVSRPRRATSRSRASDRLTERSC